MRCRRGKVAVVSTASNKCCFDVAAASNQPQSVFVTAVLTAALAARAANPFPPVAGYVFSPEP